MANKASDTMRDELGRTTLQLVKQNHATIEKTMKSVNDKTITFLDNYFFDHSRNLFWKNIETLADIREADAILERWSSDGTDYSVLLMNTTSKTPPIDLSNKNSGFKYLSTDSEAFPGWTDYAYQLGGVGAFRLIQTDDGVTDVKFIRAILNPQNYHEIVGFLVVSNLEVLLTRDLVSVQLAEDGGIYLFNELDELLMSSGKKNVQLDTTVAQSIHAAEAEGYYFEENEGEQWLVAFSYLPQFSTNLVYRIPLTSITGNYSNFQWFMMLLSFIYLLLVLLFVLYLVRIFVKPLGKLVSITKIYEPGKKNDFEKDSPRSDEFGILYGAFLRMTRRLDQSIEENYVMKIKQKENELATLHSQITPHLLYNTLDSIYWYALETGNINVGEMVKDLSKLLRIGLSKGKTIISIGEEIEHVQAYTRLQLKRFPGMFEVHWDLDETLASYLTPKVILQPIVENAILHGISSMDGEGLIWIRTRRREDHIEIAVEDNGFLPVDIARLEQIITNENQDKGYGIRNVHMRIRLHFGDKYGLKYTKREGGGVIATLTLPITKENNNL